MIVGASLYLIYHALPALHPAGPVLELTVKKVQPVLLFAMLFLSFCKIEPHQMRPHKWMLWLLLVQCGLFVGLALLLVFFPAMPLRYGVEAAMLCLICPTATACAVVTGKLGGNMAGVVTYTVLINLAVAVLVPLMVPLIHPMEGLTFYEAFLKILAKVFPLLILPALLAWLVRYLLPKVHAWLLQYTSLSFYIWAVSLTLAILMSTRAIVQNDSGPVVLWEIGFASLLSCILQFWLGRRIGRRYRCPISAGQALGQKNTVFGIWMGYTFLTPVVSVAGGFYSIWHNVYNTWQMYRKRKADEAKASSRT
ncbi:MAG: transporter [Bacteroidales bacterium]|nr:transporter [Bacteroidales bacterium]